MELNKWFGSVKKKASFFIVALLLTGCVKSIEDRQNLEVLCDEIISGQLVDKTTVFDRYKNMKIAEPISYRDDFVIFLDSENPGFFYFQCSVWFEDDKAVKAEWTHSD